MENSKQPINPLITKLENGETWHYFGLTKREYFAGLAMKGILSSQKYLSQKVIDNIPEICVELSDKLLKQLENGK